MSRAKLFAQIVERERVSAKENAQALRLQAKAWRILALIACDRPEYAIGKAQWLFVVSVPFVDGAALEQFILEHESVARECGKKVGVFK